MLPAQILGIFLLAGLSGVDAQAKFEWGFTQTTSTSLPSCQTLPLSADGLSGNNGVPPFYMIAFPIDGTPITSFIGTNESNLSWQVQYPTGTQLLLGVADSGGITGGIDTPVYTVTAGSTQCIPPATADFKITANVTDVLTACQPWGLTIEGGAPPYTVTLAVRDSHSVTNVTLGPTDSVFTYINSAKDGSQMITSVSDRNGRWATGNPFVNTTGTSTNACAGLASTSGNGTSTTSQSLQSNSKPTGNSTATASTSPLHGPAKIGAIIGGSIAGLLLVVALGLWAMWWLRRRAAQKEENASPPTDLNAFMPPSFQPSPFDHSNCQMSEAHISAAPSSLAPVSHIITSTPNGSGQMLTPGSHFSSDPHWSASAQSYTNSNSTGVPTPTSASPLVVQEDLPAPPPYGSNTINIAPLK
ncbi:hypothetical protein DFH06DRAFT_1034050 [Mycena polygramma]|nr:hypothetical protein DFH06DRAFT_1034050 [Mycena polygramma]